MSDFDSPPSRNLRPRPSQMARSLPNSSSPPEPVTTSTSSSSGTRNPPYFPTRTELHILAVYPVLLLFGAAFSLLSPETRAAPYDAVAQAHVQDASAPSYFARKNNLFNTIFVKRGWAWITAAFFVFALGHPALAAGRRRAQAVSRWALVTLWWVLVTQWCFGPALIDRGFRFTGGRCEVVELKVEEGEARARDFFTAAACKAAGGRWHGGHDISGHVFLLVLGSLFLVQEAGWVVVRARGGRLTPQAPVEERSVVMHDGAVKSERVEARDGTGAAAASADTLGLGTRVVGGVVVLSWWMVLMTAIYFHTWFEKFTGLLTALSGIYLIYFVPRVLPALRAIIGLPGL